VVETAVYRQARAITASVPLITSAEPPKVRPASDMVVPAVLVDRMTVQYSTGWNARTASWVTTLARNKVSRIAELAR
jgi:hypothetical protein